MPANFADLLERPIYTLADVDRLLALRAGTARRWIDGYERRGKLYPPLVRVAPTGADAVTWGEFVETRFLAEYRTLGASIIRMRPAIERLREEFSTKYPLAHARPFLAGRELVMRVQDQVELDSPLRLVVVRNGQYMLTDPAENFLKSVEFGEERKDGGIALRLRPMVNSAVVVDPLRQFGRPVVRSVPTDVLVEEFDAGESVEQLAALFELTRDDVESAIRYERERAKAATPSAA